MRSESHPDGQAARPSFIEQARRAQIVAAAIEVIVDEGIGQASLARIAGRAGVSKGVVSYHFAGKDALMRHVVESVYSDGATFMTPHLTAATTERERLAVYLRTNLAFIAASPTEIRALLEIASGYHPESGGRLFDQPDQDEIAAPRIAMLRAGQADGSFRDFDAEVMAHTIRAAIDAVAPQLKPRPDLDLDAYAEQLVTLFDLATRPAVPGDPS